MILAPSGSVAGEGLNPRALKLSGGKRGNPRGLPSPFAESTPPDALRAFPLAIALRLTAATTRLRARPPRGKYPFGDPPGKARLQGRGRSGGEARDSAACKPDPSCFPILGGVGGAWGIARGSSRRKSRQGRATFAPIS